MTREGTAGFLISSYKHILKANTDSGHSTLTPDDRGRLAQNFKGYDISPDMVRLSLVNMYLHGFNDPHIFEYDTLTSQDRWNEYADVILANPPFMSPKGGIKPHNRFSVQSKRSEVLFVDYMAEHLTPIGRAGIIVPEGIIFQSQSAYKQLREKLVKEYLVAVISLPAGVFQPYSGVKTSILILDKLLAKKADTIGFFKVENDGFGLGAQRRPIDKNDLPQARSEIVEYLHRLRAGEKVEGFQPALGLIVGRETVAANGEYNLSGERYRENGVRESVFPKVRLGDVLRLEFGKRITKKDNEGKLYPVYGGGGESFRTDSFNREDDAIISRFAMSKECVRLVQGKFYLLDSGFTFAISDNFIDRAIKNYIVKVLLSFQDEIYSCARGHAQKNIDLDAFKNITIPLPPLNVQKEIVAEIEGYQKIIDGARAVIDNYRPHIPINPDWSMVNLGEICEINPETINPVLVYPNQTVFYIEISSVENETGRFLGYNEIASSEAPSRARRRIKSGDVLLSTVRPNLKAFTLLREVRERSIASTGFAVLRARKNIVEPAFLFASICSDFAVSQMVSMMGKGAYPSINQNDVAAIRIPLPSLSTQQAIVTEIEAEQKLVAANRKLIYRFEKKIQATLSRIWGNDE